MIEEAMRSASKILWLGVKELSSFAHDWVLVGLVIYSFSLRHLRPGAKQLPGVA